MRERLDTKEQSHNKIPIDSHALPHHERLSAIMAETDSIIQASMLYAAALECSPTPSALKRLLENNKMGFLNDNMFTITIGYLKRHGLGRTLRQIYAKLANKNPSTLWDNSTEQYVRDGFKVYWETLKKARDYQVDLSTGGMGKDYVDYSVKMLKKRTNLKGLRGLVLGCHELDNAPEMIFWESGLFENLEVIDIAEGLVARQKKKAAHKGMDAITYTVADLNHATLEPNTYDLVWSLGTIHHIRNLETLFAQINGALKSDGLFFTRDYVGPSRLQFTDLQLSIVNGLLELLPKRYRKTIYGDTIGRVRRPSLALLLWADPSEAVRSADIVEVMTDNLHIVKLVRTGGTILAPLLNNISSNFEADPYGESLLEMLINFEKYLVQEGMVPSDYISCTAGKMAS